MLKKLLFVICLTTSLAGHAEYYPEKDHKVFGAPAVASDKLEPVYLCL